MNYDTPSFKEDHISQIPALQLLQTLGYKYLTPDEAFAARGGRLSNVILDGILTDQLRKINKIEHKGERYEFSEGNIQSAIQKLKEVPYSGLINANAEAYDLLTLGESLTQSIDGDIRSPQLKYIEWNPEKINDNVFHVTEEFPVERTGSHETRRPDIVLFVNGIPLCVIECKSPHIKDPIREAISQMLRNQYEDQIPKLFMYSQLVLALSKNEAKYGTTGTELKFWSTWKERENINDIVQLAVNTSIRWQNSEKLFGHRKKWVRERFEEGSRMDRLATRQDYALYSLCRPERLLELMLKFTLYDEHVKKVARYQQYFCVNKILSRIKTTRDDGNRSGGVVWHTQGSGKSLTMVMLAKSLRLDDDFDDHKIVLVTDRVDLDDQIKNTFLNCDFKSEQAKTGKHLGELLMQDRDQVITTVIDKFEAALGKYGIRNEDPNIFVLVDEGHRTQYGSLHAKMEKVLPNACYIAFTGTPVVKKRKNTITKFGGLIDTYTINQAVQDEAVVELIYEGRHVEQRVDEGQIDKWFDRVTEGLSTEQKADLKKKFTTTDQLNKAERKVAAVAWDISVHFRDFLQGTGFKAQLVTQDKATALLYKKYLDEFGIVSSEVLISGPDDREGSEDIYEGNKSEVVQFWKVMMDKYGSEKEYNRSIIKSFKTADPPEIIIVVDKLLTGFDAPRNTVLYLTRKLKDHTLLQAIARVNRVHDDKDYGYIIDYRGVLSELDSALDLYGKLSEFDEFDLEGTLTDVSKVISDLPQHHADLLDVFKTIENKNDEEAFERYLADEVIRNKFYEKLTRFARTLSIALASVRFFDETPEEKISAYKNDMKFFVRLRTAVKKRYAEVVDIKEYELRIKKLVDTHVSTGDVQIITEQVNIFSPEFKHEVDQLEGAASKADTIAYRMRRTISERMDEDRSFYAKFSEMIREAIEAFRQQRLSDAEYLRKMEGIYESFVSRTDEDIPEAIKHHDSARAYYGELLRLIPNGDGKLGVPESLLVETSLRIDKLVSGLQIVNWVNNSDIQNKMKNEIEDCVFELSDTYRLSLSFEAIDEFLENCIRAARARYSA
jgi:type I restriction enzyme R subunit